jgi:hypothetical protein
VEIPFIEQLKGMGWDHVEGDIDVPYLTKRETAFYSTCSSGGNCGMKDDERNALIEHRVSKAMAVAFNTWSKIILFVSGV